MSAAALTHGQRVALATEELVEIDMTGLPYTSPARDDLSLTEPLGPMKWAFRRAAVAAESAGCMLEQLRGCEVDLEDVLALLAIVEDVGRQGIHAARELADLDASVAIARSLRQIVFAAESGGALLEQLRGCRIERDDMLALFATIEEAARAGLRDCREHRGNLGAVEGLTVQHKAASEVRQ